MSGPRSIHVVRHVSATIRGSPDGAWQERVSVAISVVVPTRNRAAMLDDSLSSLSRQRSGTAYEVVVVDNGSSDATPDVIRRWTDVDERFRAIREAEPGRSNAMNAGLKIARGRVVLFTDDDVVVEDGWIDAFDRFFERETAELVIAGGPIVPVADDLEPWPAWVPDSSAVDLGGLSHGDEERRLGRYEYLWGANMGIPRALVGTLGGWDPSIGRREEHRGTFEDIEYQDRVHRRGGEVWYLPHASIRHRIPRASVTPRRIVSVAFRRGRNDISTARAFAPRGSASDPKPRTLVGGITRWAGATAALLAQTTAPRLDRARTAAYLVGWTMDTERRRAAALRTRVGWALASAIIAATPTVPRRRFSRMS
jgi:glycosyltransferase involved in cell wall biosynthesis